MDSNYSWNTFYRSPRGFVSQLTIRSSESPDLFAKIEKAEEWLLAKGCEPVDRTTGLAPAVAAQGQPQAQEPAHPEGWCAIHNCQMKKNTSDDGRTWWSHRTDEGWCKGRTNGHK